MTILDWWPAVVFGWPAIILALVLSVAGVIRKKPIWLYVAAVIVIPFTFYLFGSPRIGPAGLTIPLLLAGAGIAVRRGRYDLAWLLLAPFAGVIAWLAIIVLGE